MKSVYKITDEIINNIDHVTSYDRTKILVEASRILDKPYRNYRLELQLYSIRYKASTKTIYIYDKRYIDTRFADYEFIDDFDVTEDYIKKVSVNREIYIIIEEGFIYVIFRYINAIKTKIFNWLFRH